MKQIIVWNGLDIIGLIILAAGGILLALWWLWITIQNKIDKYFEKREK